LADRSRAALVGTGGEPRHRARPDGRAPRLGELAPLERGRELEARPAGRTVLIGAHPPD